MIFGPTGARTGDGVDLEARHLAVLLAKGHVIQVGVYHPSRVMAAAMLLCLHVELQRYEDGGALRRREIYGTAIVEHVVIERADGIHAAARVIDATAPTPIVDVAWLPDNCTDDEIARVRGVLRRPKEALQ